MNIETARYHMIEQQIRPWDVADSLVLDLLSIVKREEFVPKAWKFHSKARVKMLSPRVSACSHPA